MGKDEYLWRLSLGRSAFQPVDDHDLASSSEVDYVQTKEAEQSSPQRQLYDAKGRPVNPAKDRFDDSTRYAQNEVLAVTGVVQRTTTPAVNSLDPHNETKRTTLYSAIAAMMQALFLRQVHDVASPHQREERVLEEQ